MQASISSKREPKDIIISPAQQRTMKKAVAFFGAALLLWIAVGDEHGPVMPWLHRLAEQQRAEQLRPILEPLARQGKPDAVIWIANHGTTSLFPAVQRLANQGNTEAMLVLARSKWQTEHKEAIRLVLAAAAAGNPVAIELRQRQKL